MPIGIRRASLKLGIDAGRFCHYNNKVPSDIEKEQQPVRSFNIFVIRALLGVVFAVIATRMWYGSVEVPYVIGLAVILVGLAYFAEFLRHRKNR
jgi:hypothetical protein